MNPSDQDTIVALASPAGRGAIAIIRVAGPEAIAITSTIFAGRRSITPERAGRYYGEILAREEGRPQSIDQVVIHTYIAPHSYSGEDIVEINCHASPLIIEEILALLLRQGARLAAPGEFSKRAFLNGKIDLLQAEAVADLIAAESRAALQLSLAQLHGQLSEELQRAAADIRQAAALLELELDFSEDVEFVGRQPLQRLLTAIEARIGEILATFHYGRTLREGARLVIAGKPNVGKSSLMNRLLGRDRAIVSAIPGTTRDTLEEGLRLDGRHFHIVDTAGMRQSGDEIEQLGVLRSQEEVRQADLLLLLFDASAPLDDEDRALLAFCDRFDLRRLHLLNKCDLGEAGAAELRQALRPGAPWMRLSCHTGEGLAALRKWLVEQSTAAEPRAGSAVISRLRHFDALSRCRAALQEALATLEGQFSAEFIALDLNLALGAIGEVTGAVSRQEILNDIFSTFCIGK